MLTNVYELCGWLVAFLRKLVTCAGKWNWLRELGAHEADHGLRCSGGQEAVWLHGRWHGECYDT